MKDITYNVRVYAIETRKNAAGKVTSYRVAWQTTTKTWKRSFKNAAQADTFRGSLLTAARSGEAFSTLTGEPVSWGRTDRPEMSWYDFACKFADMKWKNAAAKYRQDIARALTAATPAMYATTRGKPDDRALRSAMHRWGFNTKQRQEASDETGAMLRWLADNTKPVSALIDDAGLIRDLLESATSLLDGTRAAPSTVRKHRMLLSNALDYAVELKLLPANPIKTLKWKPPANAYEVDRRSVVNHAQAKALLAAVAVQKPSGERLTAFFALMYYAALRPEEAVNLRRDNVTLPPLHKNTETGQMEEPANAWGELHLLKAAPYAGRDWTDSGQAREERALKHRAVGHSRTVPIPPPLVRILRTHLTTFDKGPHGRLFYGVKVGELPFITYRRAWKAARKAALTDKEIASPLAARPYDLRHACVSMWLNAGVPAPQVAEWAGHSVDVLLRIYVKCIVGQDEAAKRRIAVALAE
ncbi:tyrosine-type recombinase/integrase [Nonomuraea cavernae]|uniref:Integrase n=1 Tax=Nonomuraea cavernae TaxID=2045107 RepID=A0A918DIM0_9ACTN|nr:tyrosine-type recombinase/integrase [Nonomuraea cavernae]MCA2186941.1 tyrosine-type recombinase/integrase [Nonomuraea cavernae]GGO67117.1 integrase [Nonomuraea cavernae]